MNRLLTKLLLVFCLIGIPIAPAFAQGNPVVLSSLSHSGTIPASPGTGTVNLGAIFSDPNSLAGAYGTATFTITGGWSGTITPEVQSCDGAGTWTGLQVTPLNSSTGQSTITANGVYSGNVAGFCAVRVRGSSVATAAATATITVGSVGGGAGGGGGGGGSTTANQGTAAALTAGWPIIDGAGTDSTGSFTGTGAGTVNASIDGYSSAKIQIKGTYAGFTVNTKASSDGGVTFVPLQCALSDGTQFGSSFTLTANQSAEIACGHQSGDDTLQLQTSAGPATGTANIDISPSAFPSDDGNTTGVYVLGGGAKIATLSTPPAYAPGTNQLPTALPDGSLVTNGSAIIGTFTCSATCNTTNAGVLATFNLWNYNVLSFSVSVTDGSLVQLLCDNGDGNFQVVTDLKVYDFNGNIGISQSFLNQQGLYQSPSLIAKRCELFFSNYSGSTVTITVFAANAASPVSTVSGQVSAVVSDLNGNSTIPPVVCGSAVSSCVLKASGGYLYGVYAECSAACWLMVFNKTSAPSNGSTTAGIAANGMQECIAIPAAGVGSINYLPGPPSVFSTGITAVISSTTCATLTLATTGFIHGVVR